MDNKQVKRIRIQIVDDDEDFIFLITDMLKNQPDFQIVGKGKNKSDAIAVARSCQPDIVLMDLALSNSNLDGIEAAYEIRTGTDAKIILLTSFEDPQTVIDASVRSFASGYVFKSQFSLLNETIRKTAGGHTPQEYLILTAILAKLSSAEQSILKWIMGSETPLLSSMKTIANQKTSIFRKLKIKNQQELIHLFKTYLD